MSFIEVLYEILYLVQHSTGILPTLEHLELAGNALQKGVHPLEIKNALIMLVHEDSQRNRINSNLRSYDW